MFDELPKVKAFDWDHGNTDKILGKHSVDPFECEEVFFNEVFIVPDEQHSHTEKRYHALGITDNGRLLLIVFTVRAEKIRVISARDMSKKERKIYHEKLKEDT